MSLWVFTVSLIITLPKQLITVYLGVIFNGGEKSSKEKAISYSVLAGGVGEYQAEYFEVKTRN
jgi:hypothetical protein